MKYKILKGTEFSDIHLQQIMDIDLSVYSNEYAGTFSNLKNRFDRNNDTFVCVYDTQREKIVGYINSIPCTEGLYKSIVSESDVIRDDDITPDEISPDFSEKENNLYVISIAILAEYRGKDGIFPLLKDAWIDYLNDINKKNPINSIVATAVSSDGRKALSSLMFSKVRQLNEDETVYACFDLMLKRLLEKNLYRKTYKDDIYIFIPLADNAENKEVNELINNYSPTEDVDQTYIDAIRYCIDYECENIVKKDIELFSLGKFDVLVTTDDYNHQIIDIPNEIKKHTGNKIILGEETGYGVVMSHLPTNMHILTLIIPDCKQSTTLIEDHTSANYLKIKRRNERYSDYKNIYDYLKEYGLWACGDSKVLLYLSNKPEKDNEFYGMMYGEAYNSFTVKYNIDNNDIKNICKDNKAIYDYYQAYLSNKTIVFIPNVFNVNISERIETLSTYSFIAQLVIFQNTALARVNIKTSLLLEGDGEANFDEVLSLYSQFGKTVRFWEKQNYKYQGAQNEADIITKAFENNELKQSYMENRKFLQQIVDLKAAQIESRNGFIINVVAIILGLMEVQSFLVELMAKSFKLFDLNYSAQDFFDKLIIGIPLLFVILYLITKKKNQYKNRSMLSE